MSISFYILLPLLPSRIKQYDIAYAANIYEMIDPPLTCGMIPLSINFMQRHLNARGKETSLISLISISCRPAESGNEAAIPAKIANFALDNFNSYRLFNLSSKQIVRWKQTDESPIAKPNRATSYLTTFTILLLEMISIKSLKEAARRKFFQKGVILFDKHASYESLSV